jgi:hypothetical protein
MAAKRIVARRKEYMIVYKINDWSEAGLLHIAKNI